MYNCITHWPVAQNDQYSLWYLLARMEFAFHVSFRLACFCRDTREGMHFLWSFEEFLYWLSLSCFLLLTDVNVGSNHLSSLVNLVREYLRGYSYFCFCTSGSKPWLLFWTVISHFVCHTWSRHSEYPKSRTIFLILGVQFRHYMNMTVWCFACSATSSQNVKPVLLILPSFWGLRGFTHVECLEKQKQVCCLAL